MARLASRKYVRIEQRLSHVSISWSFHPEGLADLLSEYASGELHGGCICLDSYQNTEWRQSIICNEIAICPLQRPQLLGTQSLSSFSGGSLSKRTVRKFLIRDHAFPAMFWALLWILHHCFEKGTKEARKRIGNEGKNPRLGKKRLMHKHPRQYFICPSNHLPFHVRLMVWLES